MKLIGKFLVVIVIIPVLGAAQQADSLLKKPDSLSIHADSMRMVDRSAAPEVYEGAKLDFGTYFRLLGNNLKQQALAPFHTSKRDWLKVGAFALLTGGVALVNEPVNRFAVKLREENRATANVSKYITEFGGAYEVYALAGFYVYGLVFKTQKEKTTTVLATQAYITSGITSTVIKYLAGEQRPYYTDPNYNRSGPIFRGPFYPFRKNVDHHAYSSFPSGHTTAAFAAATVYALEYRDKPLIPIFSYTAATLIGLSRLTENKHWAADVLVGAMIGYLNGKQVVNNFHRYSAQKRGKGIGKPVSFNLQYSNRQFLSGLIYNF